MTDKISQRNKLRMQVWEIDTNIHQMMQIPKAHRNYDKIERLQDQRHLIEKQIKELS